MWRIGDDFQQSRSAVALDVRMKASGRMWTTAIAAEASVSSGLSLAFYMEPSILLFRFCLKVSRPRSYRNGTEGDMQSASFVSRAVIRGVQDFACLPP